jgi:autophagy-related protein 17
LVEEISILNARNSYSSRAVQESVDVLVNIKDGISRDGEVVASEFAQVIKRLDVANERLERTLADLRSTNVDSSLQKDRDGEKVEGGDVSEADTESEVSTQDEEEQKTLYTFIDPSKHELLQSSLRKDIDDYHSSCHNLNHTLDNFTDSLQTISGLLNQDTDKHLPNNSPLYNPTPLPIPDLFNGMVDHATAMASLLGSLVRHYDLSVTALKHTEGGGEAAKRAVQQVGDDHASTVGMEESLYLQTHRDPILDQERNEMLAVLENDAAEVEDVVSELRDRNREQEDLFSQLAEHARTAKQTDARLREILAMLHEMRDLHLPAHLDAARAFRLSWLRIRDAILDKTDELLGLAASNEGFLAAYARLLGEVERREGVRGQMRKVAEKANRELRRLWERDREEREGFLEEFGAFLPQGIWARAEEGGGLWEVREVES